MFTTNGNTMNTFGDYLFIAGMYQKISANQGQNVLPTEMYVLESYYCGSGIGRDAADNGQAQTNNADGNEITLIRFISPRPLLWEGSGVRTGTISLCSSRGGR